MKHDTSTDLSHNLIWITIALTIEIVIHFLSIPLQQKKNHLSLYFFFFGIYSVHRYLTLL